MAGERARLSRDRVLRAAVALADASGLDAVSMRRLGQELGVEAMSLYHHVRGKDDLLTGMAEIAWSQVELVPLGTTWREALARTASSVHAALLRHRWAFELHGRVGPPAQMRYLDRALGHLREGGFSAEVTYHAQHAFDAYILGYTMQVLDFSAPPEVLAERMREPLELVRAGGLPHLAEHIEQHRLHDDDDGDSGFALGLELVLDGLERLRGNGAQRPNG